MEAVSYLDDEPQRRKGPLKWEDGKVTVKEHVSQEGRVGRRGKTTEKEKRVRKRTVKRVKCC